LVSKKTQVKYTDTMKKINRKVSLVSKILLSTKNRPNKAKK